MSELCKEHLAWCPACHRSPGHVSLTSSPLSPTPAQEQDTLIIKSLSPFIHKETESQKNSGLVVSASPVLPPNTQTASLRC